MESNLIHLETLYVFLMHNSDLLLDSTFKAKILNWTKSQGLLLKITVKVDNMSSFSVLKDATKES